jgi:hypothetical protein
MDEMVPAFVQDLMGREAQSGDGEDCVGVGTPWSGTVELEPSPACRNLSCGTEGPASFTRYYEGLGTMRGPRYGTISAFLGS